jgi:hypothetical protein
MKAYSQASVPTKAGGGADLIDGVVRAMSFGALHAEDLCGRAASWPNAEQGGRCA